MTVTAVRKDPQTRTMTLEAEFDASPERVWQLWADLAVSLAALKDWSFLFGPGLVVPFGNGLILGYLMYSSGLVPPRMAWLGLIGGPLLLIGNIGVLFDWWEPTSPAGLLVAPEFLWELSLGIYAAVWGFRRDSPILSPRAG
jgi:hypothetical protein